MFIRKSDEKVTKSSDKILRQLTERHADLHYEGAPADYEDPADYVRVGRISGRVIA